MLDCAIEMMMIIIIGDLIDFMIIIMKDKDIN
jgi:hypothetical protein